MTTNAMFWLGADEDFDRRPELLATASIGNDDDNKPAYGAAAGAPRRMMTINGAVTYTGDSRTKIYELMAAGLLDARKSGRRVLITVESIDAYLDNLPKATFRMTPRKAA